MKYFIKTFGCQQNKADSERLASFLEKKGMTAAEEIKKADYIVINTCMVRQSAEERIYGLIRNLVKLKKKSPNLKIVLTGCLVGMAEKDKTGRMKQFLKKRLPEVDEFLAIEEVGFKPKPLRLDKIHAWVPIMEGCDNFCTYCVVPYARGREKSRSFEEIVCEVKTLAQQGYKKITLLGQNVNSYGKDIKNLKFKMKNETLQIKYQKEIIKKYQTPFALLLAVLHGIPGIEKISFITSNPWDLTDDLIEAMSLPKIDRQFHLPVQSGDDKVLKKMNRRYTAKQYLNLIEKIKAKIPDIKISTDIIVGFPGETKKQFQNTVKLCKKVGFSKAYIAMYSPRSLTTASKVFQDNVSYKEKKRRWQALEKLINLNPPRGCTK